MLFYGMSWVNPPIFSFLTLLLDPPQMPWNIQRKILKIQRKFSFFIFSAMTYDTNNIWQYGCLWNRHYLKSSEKVHKHAKKMKNERTKISFVFLRFFFVYFRASAQGQDEEWCSWKWGDLLMRFHIMTCTKKRNEKLYFMYFE